jgi:hypothetical protein
MSGQNPNLSTTERVGSAAIGTALSLLVFRRGGGPVLRSLAAVAGLGLLARSLAGHCAVKAAVTGQSTLGQGVRAQWRRMSGRPETDVVDPQEAVEENANPAAVQEGLPVNGALSPRSSVPTS